MADAQSASRPPAAAMRHAARTLRAKAEWLPRTQSFGTDRQFEQFKSTEVDPLLVVAAWLEAQADPQTAAPVTMLGESV